MIIVQVKILNLRLKSPPSVVEQLEVEVHADAVPEEAVSHSHSAILEIQSEWLQNLDAADPLPSPGPSSVPETPPPSSSGLSVSHSRLSEVEDDGTTYRDENNYVYNTASGKPIGRITYSATSGRPFISCTCYLHKKCSVIKTNDHRLPYGAELLFQKWLFSGIDIQREDANLHKSKLQSFFPAAASSSSHRPR